MLQTDFHPHQSTQERSPMSLFPEKVHSAGRFAAALLSLGSVCTLIGCVATAPVTIPATEFPKIEPASASVPKECAAFLGGWAGTWTNGNFGQLRLWVTKVTETCEANFTYSGRDGVAKISNGTLPVPCGGGTCYFSPSGDSLAGTYSQSSSQRASFGRIIAAK
jgi:hypothetical protein